MRQCPAITANYTLERTICMEVKYMNVTELNPYQNNPRKNDKAVKPVMASIKEFGFKVPITVDKNMVIVTGHTRLKAAIKLGMEKVPVIVLDDLNEDQVKAFRLADNKTSEFAEWDFEALAIELEEINMDMSEFEFEIPGMGASIQDDDFDIELPKVPKAKYGDIYKLGRHRLMCGDATDLKQVEELMGQVVADVFITDPPYNVDYEGTAGKIINDKQEDSQFQTFLTDAFSAANFILKPGGTFYIWHADSEGYNFRSACKNVGWQIRQCLIWKKNSLVLGRQDYQWIHEPCLYGWKAGASHYFIDDRSITTVMDEDRPSRSEDHPTMKPVKLIGRLISNSSKKNDTVVDTFAGSGTTLIAAEQLNRTAYLMELDPKYVDVIIERYEAFTGNKAEKIN